MFIFVDFVARNGTFNNLLKNGLWHGESNRKKWRKKIVAKSFAKKIHFCFQASLDHHGLKFFPNIKVRSYKLLAINLSLWYRPIHASCGLESDFLLVTPDDEGIFSADLKNIGSYGEIWKRWQTLLRAFWVVIKIDDRFWKKLFESKLTSSSSLVSKTIKNRRKII